MMTTSFATTYNCDDIPPYGLTGSKRQQVRAAEKKLFSVIHKRDEKSRKKAKLAKLARRKSRN